MSWPRYGRYAVKASPPEPTTKVECPGCRWPLADAQALAVHKEKCEQAKALALPKDDDAAGWDALAERMKRAAATARAIGRNDEADGYIRRSEACAEQAQRARAANTNKEG